MGFGANGGFDFTKKLKEMLRKKDGVWSERWICFTKEKVFLGIEQIVKKKDGVGANGGFDFTKKLKEMLRKKMGFGVNGGFDFI